MSLSSKFTKQAYHILVRYVIAVSDSCNADYYPWVCCDESFLKEIEDLVDINDEDRHLFRRKNTSFDTASTDPLLSHAIMSYIVKHDLMPRLNKIRSIDDDWEPSLQEIKCVV